MAMFLKIMALATHCLPKKNITLMTSQNTELIETVAKGNFSMIPK